jgi:hypothetical protein
MARLMRNKETKSTLKIKEHIILRNFWEYYVIDKPSLNLPEDIEFCLVMGFETEMGDVYMPEIKPYVISKTKRLEDLAPVPGWEWVD